MNAMHRRQHDILIVVGRSNSYCQHLVISLVYVSLMDTSIQREVQLVVLGVQKLS